MNLNEAIAVTGCVSHFHYGEERDAFNIRTDETTVLLRLTRPEMEYMLALLAHDQPEPAKPETAQITAWWDDSTDTEAPELCVYHNDYFSVDLPHQCGVDLLAALQERLGATPVPDVTVA